MGRLSVLTRDDPPKPLRISGIRARRQVAALGGLNAKDYWRNDISGTGGLTVAVDAVPIPITAIHQGDIVGSVRVEPGARVPPP